MKELLEMLKAFWRELNRPISQEEHIEGGVTMVQPSSLYPFGKIDQPNGVLNLGRPSSAQADFDD